MQKIRQSIWCEWFYLQKKGTASSTLPVLSNLSTIGTQVEGDLGFAPRSRGNEDTLWESGHLATHDCTRLDRRDSSGLAPIVADFVINLQAWSQSLLCNDPKLLAFYFYLLSLFVPQTSSLSQKSLKYLSIRNWVHKWLKWNILYQRMETLQLYKNPCGNYLSSLSLFI